MKRKEGTDSFEDEAEEDEDLVPMEDHPEPDEEGYLEGEEDLDEDDTVHEPEYEEEIVADEEDIWGEEEGIDRPGSDTERKGPWALLAIFAVSILIVAGIGGALLVLLTGDEDEDDGTNDRIDPFDRLGSDRPSANPFDARFSEVDPAGEWFEIYLESGSGDISEWTFTTFDEPLTPLPDVEGAGGYDHIMVYMGNGTDDTDCSDGSATLHLGLPGDVLGDDGDEMALFDGDGHIIDFIAWGVGNGDTPREGWSNVSYIIAPPAGSSISLQGPDLDRDSFWMVGPPSPGSNNIVEMDLGDGWSIHLINGRTAPYMPRYHEDIDNFDAIAPPIPAVNVTVTVPRGQPVNSSMVAEIQEYISFTYGLLKKMGFGEATSSGTDAQGRPIIRVTVTANGTYSGVCMPDGSIQVDLGTSKVTNKKLTEHEMTHNFQWKKRPNGAGHLGPLITRFLEEGMAELIGRYSTTKNFNMTWAEVERELQRSGNLNIVNYTGKSHINIFTDWFNATGRPYYAGIWEYYEIAFLFWKFLWDKFGPGMVSKIFNETSYGGSGPTVIGIAAIEAATGQKIEDLIREFMLYRLENRFPQYRSGIDYGPIRPDQEINVTGTPVTTPLEWVERYGSRVNRFIMNGRGGIIDFQPRNPDTRWGITVIQVKPDGSRSYENRTIGPGQNGTIVIPPGVKEVIVIKTLYNLSSSTSYEWFNMTVRPLPVITPTRPINNDHILWDPDPEYFKWLLENLTKDMRLRIQMDNTSTFLDPEWEDVIGWNATMWPFPGDITNGTWWWRLRWETDGHNGEWTPYRNFTIWRGFERPEIMWDPAPIRFENGSGSWVVVIPNSTVMIGGYHAPPELGITEGEAEFRLRGHGLGSEVFKVPFGEAFPLGDHMEEGIDTLEWRVVFPPFGDFPWFRVDIMWDPALPEWEILVPLDGSRHRNDTRMVIQANLSSRNGSFAVDSFFDVFYSIGPGTLMPYGAEVVPTSIPGRYEVFINASMLPEGYVSFLVRLRDRYGRVSENVSFRIVVDRTAPSLEVWTDPEREAYNGPFEIVIRSSDVHLTEGLLEFFYPDGSDSEMELATPVPVGEGYGWRIMVDPYSIPEGSSVVRVTVRDDLGNQRVLSREFHIDVTAPVIEVFMPLPETIVGPGSDVLIVAGIVEADLTNVRYAYAVMVDSDGIELGNVTMSRFDMTWEGAMIAPFFEVQTDIWIRVYALDWAGNMGVSGDVYVIGSPD